MLSSVVAKRKFSFLFATNQLPNLHTGSPGTRSCSQQQFSTKDVSPRTFLDDVFNKSIKSYLKSGNHGNINEFARIDGSQISHYRCSNPLSLSKRLKQPVDEVAKQIIEHSKQFLNNKKIAEQLWNNAGFIEIKLSEDWISQRIHTVANFEAETKTTNGMTLPVLVKIDTCESKNVLIDYSSPNMAKELHVGHLRSTILGESLSRILCYLGHNIERISHVGDFGTPIGTVIAQAIYEKDEKIINSFAESNFASPSELSALYVRAKSRTANDLDFSQLAHRITLKLQEYLAGIDPSPILKVKVEDKEVDVDIFSCWKRLCSSSRIGFQQIYDKMGIIKLEERGESFYASFLDSISQELKEKGLSVLSEGAECIFLEGSKTPFLVRKSDRSFLYTTTDLAAIRHRIQQGKNWLIYVTDDSQKLHFQHLFKVAQLAGWLKPSDTKVDHVTFGVIKGVDGKKLSSRDGSASSFSLMNLLEQSHEEARKVLQDIAKTQTREDQLSTKDQDDIVTSVGINAVKYYDLRHPRDYIFSFESMLSLKGNTAVYLMYAYTRIRSIRRKIKQMALPESINHNSDLKFKTRPVFHQEEERALALCVVQFADVIALMEFSMAPHHLCEYLFDLASRFHTFYEKCRIIGSQDTQLHSRLQLCVATEKILFQGLQLLGLNPTERM